MDLGIKGLLSSSKVALEKQATDSFGAAAEDFIKGKFAGKPPGTTDVSGVYKPESRDDVHTWYSSSYAAALAGTTFRPKLKFLFKVEFGFDPKLQPDYPQLFGANANDFTFMIKSVDRPKVDFEYEEEVNQYNFRTKVLKKITHRELTLTFMDDVGNRVFEFFRTLMLIYSPITRGGLDREQHGGKPEAKVDAPSGMTFKGLKTGFNAHRGVINSEAGQAIRYIRISQFFMDPSATSLSSAPKMVYWDFINPRLKSFDLDDMNHETSDANLLTMMFDYDWMEMVKVDKIPGPVSPVFPGVSPTAPTAPADLLLGVTGTGSGSSVTGGNNPFANIIQGKLAGAAQQMSSTLINKAVSSIAGKGVVGQILGSATNSISAQVGSSVNGLIGGGLQSASNYVSTGATSMLSNAMSGISNKFTSLIKPAASDSSTLNTVTNIVKSGGG